MRELATINRCEICDHRWYTGEKVPRNCASCKRRNWNTANLLPEVAESLPTVAKKDIPLPLVAERGLFAHRIGCECLPCVQQRRFERQQKADVSS